MWLTYVPNLQYESIQDFVSTVTPGRKLHFAALSVIVLYCLYIVLAQTQNLQG